MSGLRNTSLILLLVLLGGCASTPDEHADPRDPMESYNRKVFRFNQAFDDKILKPVAKRYKAIVPEPINRGITNFFRNIADINSVLNNLLQLKLSRAGSDIARLAVNTTVGVVGFFDVATNLGFPSYKEDLGQTFGYWGDDSSAYMVLFFLGPSTLRDAIGLTGGMVTNPFFYLNNDPVYWGLNAVEVLDTRADLLNAGELLEEMAIDPYIFTRNAYLQSRRNKIFDGSPPESPEEEDIWMDESDAEVAANDSEAAVPKPEIREPAPDSSQ